jgi:hypothetical protein
VTPAETSQPCESCATNIDPFLYRGIISIGLTSKISLRTIVLQVDRQSRENGRVTVNTLLVMIFWPNQSVQIARIGDQQIEDSSVSPGASSHWLEACRSLPGGEAHHKCRYPGSPFWRKEEASRAARTLKSFAD